MTCIDYTGIDAAICEHLKFEHGHPTNSEKLCKIASGITSGEAWRLVDRRMTAMKKAGLIRFTGNGRNNPSGKRHGWIVLVERFMRGEVVA